MREIQFLREYNDAHKRKTIVTLNDNGSLDISAYDFYAEDDPPWTIDCEYGACFEPKEVEQLIALLQPPTHLFPEKNAATVEVVSIAKQPNSNALTGLVFSDPIRDYECLCCGHDHVGDRPFEAEARALRYENELLKNVIHGDADLAPAARRSFLERLEQVVKDMSRET